MIQLKTGDFLFQLEQKSDLDKAISEVTIGRNQVSYTHMGIILIEKGMIQVVEAISAGVVLTPLQKFLDRSSKKEGKPVVMATRLKSNYNEIIESSMERVKQLLGKPYDYTYIPNNEKYYCSEIISECFLTDSGEKIFPPKPMKFQDENENISKYWQEHYQKFDMEVPVGVLGTNPGNLSKSKEIEVIHFYFD